MLAISLKKNEAVKIGDSIVILTRAQDGTARIGIHADRSVDISPVVILPQEEQRQLLAMIPKLVTRLDADESTEKAAA